MRPVVLGISVMVAASEVAAAKAAEPAHRFDVGVSLGETSNAIDERSVHAWLSIACRLAATF